MVLTLAFFTNKNITVTNNRSQGEEPQPCWAFLSCRSSVFEIAITNTNIAALGSVKYQWDLVIHTVPVRSFIF